jgi:hypothetical protein
MTIQSAVEHEIKYGKGVCLATSLESQLPFVLSDEVIESIVQQFDNFERRLWKCNRDKVFLDILNILSIHIYGVESHFTLHKASDRNNLHQLLLNAKRSDQFVTLCAYFNEIHHAIGVVNDASGSGQENDTGLWNMYWNKDYCGNDYNFDSDQLFELLDQTLQYNVILWSSVS